MATWSSTLFLAQRSTGLRHLYSILNSRYASKSSIGRHRAVSTVNMSFTPSLGAAFTWWLQRFILIRCPTRDKADSCSAPHVPSRSAILP